MARISEEKAAELRKDIPKAIRYNREIRRGVRDPEECPGCFGAGRGTHCCMCGGKR